MIDAIHLLVILIAAACMFVPAVRHPEWRGGLLSMGFVFVAVALEECSHFWESLIPGIDEPEVVFIAVALICSGICAFVWRGTFFTAVSAIYRNRRFPILVWGLLFVTFLPNAAKAKGLWAFCAPGVEATHDLRELAEGAVRFFGHILLLNWSVLFLRDKRIVLRHRLSPHENLLWSNPLIPIGRGSRRQAYKVGDTGFCAKFYLPPEECVKGKMKNSIRREIRWRRFSRFYNSSSQEVYVYRRFRHTLPEKVRACLPEVCERVYHPRLGWGVLETFYSNPDGTAVIPYEFEIARQTPGNREIIYNQAEELLKCLCDHSALFYEPGNFHTLINPDGTIETRIVDFEPTSKNLIPLEAFIPWLRRMKLRRKARRYLAHLRRKYDIPGHSFDWLAAESVFGTRFASFSRIHAGNSSRNYRATAYDGRSYFIKIAPADSIAQLLDCHSSGSSVIPGVAFGGRTGKCGNLCLGALEWCEGRNIDPAEMSVAQIKSLVEKYQAFSDFLNGMKGERRPAWTESLDFGIPQGTIHGDFHCCNYFFRGDEVVSFFDFEMMRRGWPTEDLLRVFLQALERTRFFRLGRLGALYRNLGALVRFSPYPAKAWIAAIDAHEAYKNGRRFRKAKVKLFAKAERWFRAPLYRKVRQIVTRAKGASR